MKIAIGSDHAGYQAKEVVKKYLLRQGYPVKDFGTDSETPVDYPDFGKHVARAVARRRFSRGILICGSGLGMTIVANRFKGIRATNCYNKTTARLARLHNDANILCLGSRLLSPQKMKGIIQVWLSTPFAGGRHQRRIEKIDPPPDDPLPMTES